MATHCDIFDDIIYDAVLYMSLQAIPIFPTTEIFRMTDIAPLKVPTFRKLWLVVTLTVLLITMPVAMVILLTGPVFRKRADGWQPLTNGARYAFGGALVVWLVAAMLKGFLQPGGLQGEWERSANPSRPDQTATQTTTAAATEAPARTAEPASEDIAHCNAPETIETVKSIIEENGGNQLQRIQVIDFGQVEERWYEADKKRRGCKALADLNSGATVVAYIIRLGPSGKQVVQADIGAAAENTLEVESALTAEYKRRVEAGENPSLDNHLAIDPNRGR